ARHAAHDGARRLLRRRTAGRVSKRIEEGCDEAELLLIGIDGVWVADDIEVRIEAIDRLGQHGVAEAVDRMRELRDDRGVEIDIVDLGRCKEGIDIWLDGPREFLE